MEMEFFVPGRGHEVVMVPAQERYEWYRASASKPENLRCASTRRRARALREGLRRRRVQVPVRLVGARGHANRSDFDLKQHTQFSGKDLSYFDEEARRRVPYVIHAAAGADRATLAFLVDSYDGDEVEGETRAVLRLHPRLAPVKAAVFPADAQGRPARRRRRRSSTKLRPHFPVVRPGRARSAAATADRTRSARRASPPTIRRWRTEPSPSATATRTTQERIHESDVLPSCCAASPALDVRAAPAADWPPSEPRTLPVATPRRLA